MIRINLLPEKEGARPAAKAKVVSEDQVSPLTYLIIVVLVAAIGGYYYMFAYRRVSAKRVKAAEVKHQVDVAAKQVESFPDVGELKKAERITKSMLDVVYALDSPDRVLWSQKLNALSDLIPENVFLKRLTVSETINKVETADSVQRRKDWEAEQKGKVKAGRGRRGVPAGSPAQIFYPQITQELRIYGIAYSENEAERIRLINELHDNLMSGVNAPAKVKTDFMKGFSGEIAYGDVTPNAIGGRPVAEFSFNLKTTATGPKTVAPPATAAAEKGQKGGAGEEAVPAEKGATDKAKAVKGAAKGRRTPDVE